MSGSPKTNEPNLTEFEVPSQFEGRVWEGEIMKDGDRKEDMDQGGEGYREIVDLSPDGVMVHTDGIITYANASLARLFGAPSPEGMIGKQSIDLAAPEERERILQRRSAVNAGEERTAEEAKFFQTDGSETYLERTTSRVNWNGKPSLLVIFRDINEKKKLELIHDENEQINRAIIELIPAAFIIQSAGRIVFANGRANEMFGVEEGSSLTEIDSLAIVDEEYRDQVLNLRKAVEDSGQPSQIERARHRTLQGAILETQTIIGPFTWHDQPATINMIVDQTEHQQMEAQLRRSQKLEAVGQLTSGVSHDFNNLLAVTMGSAAVLSLKLKGDPKMQALAKSIIKAAERGSELTHRLLAFSRSQELQPKSLQLGALCDGMKNMLKRTLGETIEVELTTNDETWDVLADPGQLESALLNLAINASHAMPKGGKLTVTSENAPVSEGEWVERWEGQPGDYVALKVIDTGVGMSAEVIEQVFEPFFTTKELGQGSGMGLSMVYGFAQQSGGFVTVDSIEEEGTTVTIYLPRAEPDRGSIESNVPDAEIPQGRGETILLIEDDAAVRTSTTELLDLLGYTVLTAEDGASALEFLSSTQKIDLLLSDMTLPGGMNGIDIYGKFHEQQPGLNCLFISGYAALPDRTLPKGAEILSKPVNMEILAGKIRQILDD